MGDRNPVTFDDDAKDPVDVLFEGAFLVGIALSSLAALVGTLGKVLMRVSHQQGERAEALLKGQGQGGAGKDGAGKDGAGKDGDGDGAAATNGDTGAKAEGELRRGSKTVSLGTVQLIVADDADAADADAEKPDADGGKGDDDAAAPPTAADAGGAGGAGGAEAEAAALKRKSWVSMVTGLVCIVVLNPAGDLAAYKFAKQSVIAPLSGLPIVFNALLAPKLAGETLRFEDKVGSSWVFSGLVMVAVASMGSTPEYSIAELRDFFARGSFTVYACVMGVAVALLLYVSFAREPTKKEGDIRAAVRRSPSDMEEAAAAAGQQPDACDADAQQQQQQQQQQNMELALNRFAFGAVAGIVGGQQYLMKNLSRCLGLMDAHPNPWTDAESPGGGGFPWLMLACVVLSAGGGLWLLNQGLKRYAALFIVPTYQSFLIVASTYSAVAYFHELYDVEAWNYVLYFLGVFLILWGVLMVCGAVAPLPSASHLARVRGALRGVCPGQCGVRAKGSAGAAASEKKYLHPDDRPLGGGGGGGGGGSGADVESGGASDATGDAGSAPGTPASSKGSPRPSHLAIPKHLAPMTLHAGSTPVASSKAAAEARRRSRDGLAGSGLRHAKQAGDGSAGGGSAGGGGDGVGLSLGGVGIEMTEGGGGGGGGGTGAAPALLPGGDSPLPRRESDEPVEVPAKNRLMQATDSFVLLQAAAEKRRASKTKGGGNAANELRKQAAQAAFEAQVKRSRGNID